MSWTILLELGVFIIILLVAVLVFFYYVPVGLWLSAQFSGVRISLIQLVLMRIRKVPPAIIVNALINATKAGIILDARALRAKGFTEKEIADKIAEQPARDKLEAHFLAGGNVPNVINALISADKANIPLNFKLATAIDLAGRDVFDAVQTSVYPKVITTQPVTAVAKNGIQLVVTAKVTVRSNIEQLVGGAGEATIIARVGEGIVSSIGSAPTHSKVLENPDSISKLVLAKGLDSGTAFEILSIDIADVDIGKNIGAELQTDQAEADKKIAQAKAEQRRAMAIAEEQEMKAKAQQARANVIQAEAEVPLAISEAFRNGQLGVMDYYRYTNIKADTSMRESIANSTSFDSEVESEIETDDDI